MSRTAITSLRPLLRPTPLSLSVRHSSSSSSSPLNASTEPASASTSSSNSTSPEVLPLPWPKYLSLRRERRLWSTFSTVPTTFAGLFLGGGYFAGIEADPSQLIMGIEPMFVYGGATPLMSSQSVLGVWVSLSVIRQVGTKLTSRDTPLYPPSFHPIYAQSHLTRPLIPKALGYLAGPTVGSALFSFTHPSVARGNPSPLEVMDREFYHRIVKNRADPRFQSVQNIVPDFYGEKIVSLSTYRRWLRDQAAYNKKAQHGVPGEEQ
ncbi:hypothetical protein IAT38_001045 [Cryptococcus sp. DSM 104549]